MKRYQEILHGAVIAVACWAVGCGDTAGPSASKESPLAENSSVSTDDTQRSNNGLPSEVVVTAPQPAEGFPSVVRAEGTFNPSAHDSQSRFEFKIEGQLTWTVRMSMHEFVGDEWMINPLADVSNPTGSEVHVRYNAAFFNDSSELVGCCSQDASVESSETPLQLGSLIVKGPKNRLLTATRFQITIYEARQHIGVEPLDREAIPEIADETGKVITTLQTSSSGAEPDTNSSALRLQADVAFEEPVDRRRSTHLKLNGVTEYDLYLSTRRSETLLTSSNAESERFVRWLCDVEFEPQERLTGVATDTHAALLNGEGKLVTCSGNSSTRRLAAPQDELLGVSTLKFVAYEPR